MKFIDVNLAAKDLIHGLRYTVKAETTGSELIAKCHVSVDGDEVWFTIGGVELRVTEVRTNKLT